MFDDLVQQMQAARVYDVARPTPLEHAPRLSGRLANDLWLKREDLQSVFSFKLRGAYQKMASLSAEDREQGVVAASAGNHAQGVALGAQRLGCQATIVMPVTTPDIKVSSVRRLGAEVILHGDSFDVAQAHAMELAESQARIFIPPYDDEQVIIGQGTVGLEILQQLSGDLHAVFVCVGGGGLIAGVGAAIKQARPEVKIIGVEPEDAASLKAALQAGQPVPLEDVGIFADGAAVRQVGDVSFRIAREVVDEMITADTDEICAAIKDAFEDTRSILEPAGALAIAGAKKYAVQSGRKGENWVAIASGANMNFDRLRHVLERSELGEHREAILAVTIPERPGSFRAFCEVLGRREVTEFNYRFADQNQAHIFVGVQVQGLQAARQLQEELNQAGFDALDLTENEMAKLHVRYMVGGKAPQAAHERLFRFHFPERPGALLRFLEAMAKDWNISLFHYRNHGSAIGRVLVGMQVPPEDEVAFQAFKEQVGYPYIEETDNPAYAMFL